MLLGWSLTPQKRDTDLQQESGTLKEKKIQDMKKKILTIKGGSNKECYAEGK